MRAILWPFLSQYYFFSESLHYKHFVVDVLFMKKFLTLILGTTSSKLCPADPHSTKRQNQELSRAPTFAG